MPRGHNIFESGSSGGGGGGTNIFEGGTSGSRASRSRAKKHGGGGFFHTIAHPFEEAGQTIGNLGVGIYEAGKTLGSSTIHPDQQANKAAWDALFAGHPVRAYQIESQGNEFERQIVTPTLKTYAHKYGPLFQGHPLTTLERAAHDPIGTALDAWTIATLGAGAAARSGLIASAPRAVEIRSLGETGVGRTVERPVVGTELSRRLKISARAAANRLPEWAPGSELRAYSKVVRKESAREQARLNLQAVPQTRAAQALSKKERIAANLIQNYPSRPLLEDYKRSLSGKPEAAQTLKILNDPTVLKHFDAPTAKMELYLSESEQLGNRGAALLGLEDRTQRQYLPALLARGAKFEGAPVAGTEVDLGRSVLWQGRQGKLVKLDVTPEAVDPISAAYKRYYREAAGEPDAMSPEEFAQYAKDHPAQVERYMPPPPSSGPFALVRFPGKGGKGTYTKTVPLDELTQTGQRLVAPAGQTIEDMIGGIRSELAAAGRPEPIYQPHTSIVEKRGLRIGSGGSAPQRIPVHQSHGHLVSIGRARFDINTHIPTYLRAVKYAIYRDRHSDLLASGMEIPVGTPKPEGWEYVKQVASEKFGYQEKVGVQFERELRNLDSSYANEMTTDDAAQALTTDNGTHVIVPARLREQIVGQYQHSNNVLLKTLTNFTDVWRAAVLNYSPRWLVNNIVGNTLLYAIAASGHGGLTAWLKAMSDTKGADWVIRRIVRDRHVRGRITAQDMADVLPDQVANVILETERPTAGLGGALTSSKYAPGAYTRKLDVGYEQKLRQAIANTVIARSPEVRARLKAMPKETRSFRAAARHELTANPQLARRVSAQVNAALGDFGGMSALEQNVIRRAVPFYAWYRAITLVAAKLPVDAPFRTEILTALGQIGTQNQAKGYPYGGAIDLGGNQILRTTGSNPFQTIPQVVGDTRVLGQALLARTVGGVPTPDQYAVQHAAGLLNPLAAVLTGGTRGSVAENLPQARLIWPYKPTHPEKGLYSDYGRQAEILQWLGIPLRRLNPDQNP